MKDKTEIIQLKNIQTIYEGEKIPVIKNINLSIKQHEFVCVIGPNGAGKTTLLETINGILDYTGGKGYVFGHEIKKHKQLIRKETGYVLQNFEIDSKAPFLCKDVVMLGRSGKIGVFRLPTKKDWEKVWYSMSLVGMIDYAKRPIGKLSGGEFQKILLARALAQQPNLLLLDEPFSNLDITSKSQIETLINRLYEKYKLTIIMVSHDLNYIPTKCNRIIIIDRGTIVLDDEKDKVMKSKFIIDLFRKNGVKK